MNWIDEKGNPVTEEDIERWAKAAEEGDFSEFADASDCIYGKPQPLNVAKATISFVSTENVNEELTEIANFRHCSKSDVLRAFVHDGIQREKELMLA